MKKLILGLLSAGLMLATLTPKAEAGCGTATWYSAPRDPQYGYMVTAHPFRKIGSIITVTGNGRSIVVKVIDRSVSRVDLSQTAFRALFGKRSLSKGIGRVCVS